MFLGALKVTLLTSLVHPGPERGLTTLAVIAGMLLLVFLLSPVLRVAHALLSKGDGRGEPLAAGAAAPSTHRSPAPRNPSAAARALVAERPASTGWVRLSTRPASGMSSSARRSTK
jgi:hypothetical protein